MSPGSSDPKFHTVNSAQNGGRDDWRLSGASESRRRVPAVMWLREVIPKNIFRTCAALAVPDMSGSLRTFSHLPEVPERRRTPSRACFSTTLAIFMNIQAGIDYLRTQSCKKRRHRRGRICYGGKLHDVGSRSAKLIVVPYPGPTSAVEIARLKSPTQRHCGLWPKCFRSHQFVKWKNTQGAISLTKSFYTKRGPGF